MALVVLAVTLGIFLAHFIFCKPSGNRDIYISNYEVSDDGREITLGILVPTSKKYVRDVKVYEKEGGEVCIDCNYKFSGTEDKRNLPLKEDRVKIGIYID